MSRSASDFLATTTGLDADALGAGALDAAVAARCSELGLDEAALVARLRRDPAEADAFLARLLVHETWLFRDRVPFEALGAFAVRRAREGRLPMRVLSFPCATGEEAWSIAATLLDAGLAPRDFRVVACDLEPRALEIAARGVYPARVFRGNRDLRAGRLFRGFVGDDGQDRVEAPAPARPSVEFRRMNLLDVGGLADLGPFDAIFCRNALVYMTAPSRRRVIADLRALLAPGAILVVGHSEVPTLLGLGYRPVGPPGAFTLAPPDEATSSGEAQRPSPREATRRHAGVASSPARPGLVAEDGGRDDVARESSTGSAEALRAATDSAGRAVLAEARRLADAGRNDDAERLVRRHLDEHPASAEAHLLLGVLLAAARRPSEAREVLERAVYLDPSCEEALLHLAAIVEGAGDRAAAERLRARAARLEARS